MQGFVRIGKQDNPYGRPALLPMRRWTCAWGDVGLLLQLLPLGLVKPHIIPTCFGAFLARLGMVGMSFDVFSSLKEVSAPVAARS